MSDEDVPVAAADEAPKKGARKKVDTKDGTENAGEVRGPLTPEQFDDDGWGDTPVQMRG